MRSTRSASTSPRADAPAIGRAFISTDGTIAEADAALASLLGRAQTELLGVSAATLLLPLGPAAAAALLSALDGGDAAEQIELDQFLAASGARRRWLLSLYPVCSRLGTILGVDLELRPWSAPGETAPFPADEAAIALLRAELDRDDRLFRALFEQSPVGKALLNPNGALLHVNRGFCDIVGYSPAELRAAYLHDLAHPDDRPGEAELLARIMAGESVAPGERRYRHRDGQYIWVRVSRSLVASPGGERSLGLLVVQDIGAERQLREALQRSESLMRDLWEHAAFGVLIGASDGTIAYANPALARLLGYSVEELSSRTLRWADLTPPAFAARDAEATAELFARGSCAPYEKCYTARDGRQVPVLVGASLLDAGPGGAQVAAAFVTDLTALKAAEAEQLRLLQISEERAARAVALLSLTAALSRALTPERVAQAVIDEACSIFGAFAGVVLNLDPVQAELGVLEARGYSDELIAPWQRFPLTVATPLSDAVRRGELVLLCTPEERERLYPHLSRDYGQLDARAWAAVPLKLDQQVVGALGLSFHEPRSFDEDERTYLMTIAGLCAQALERARLSAAERAALDAADEALAMLDTVVDSAPIGLAYLDTEFRYRRINPRLAAMNGLPVAEHLGRRARDLFPKMAPAWEPHWQHVLATAEPVAGLVFSGPKRDGRMGHAQVSFYPVRVGDGQVLGVGVLVLDVTQQKEAEEERTRLLASEQAARAAAQEAQARAEAALQLREAFLSIAAHELKTPLTSLLGQAQLLERRLAGEGLLTDQNARSLQVVVGQARRLSHLIGDLLDGANLELGQLAIRRLPVELGRLVRKVAEELQPTAPGHQLSVRVLDGPVTVQADPIRMEQVIQNLLGNAVKYSPRGSEVAVEVRCVDGEALVSVRDRGVGIPAEALPRLFERFYRVASAETSSVSGVGVGLYVVREIVRLHNGEVRVESTPGEGSTFTVALPLKS